LKEANLGLYVFFAKKGMKIVVIADELQKAELLSR
jgi:hypothetical protein